MIRRPPRSTQSRSSAASDVYKRQVPGTVGDGECPAEVSRHLSSVSTHQVQGGAKDGERRVHACLNGNPATQRGAPGMTEPVQTICPPLPHQEPEGHGRTMRG